MHDGASTMGTASGPLGQVDRFRRVVRRTENAGQLGVDSREHDEAQPKGDGKVGARRERHPNVQVAGREVAGGGRGSSAGVTLHRRADVTCLTNDIGDEMTRQRHGQHKPHDPEEDFLSHVARD